LKAKAYHLAAKLLDQPIFDISVNNGSCTEMTPASFLCYFYYGALVRIGLKEYLQALQLLLVALTFPASCLSAIQADACKKYALVSLKVHGELKPLPVYASNIVQMYSKSPGYTQEIAEAFRVGDPAALSRIVEEKSSQILADGNMGLVKQVVESLHRHKVQTLTKTYLTLSLVEIAKELGVEEARVGEVEELLFDMISAGEINARIDQSTGNVSFEDDDGEMDANMVDQVQGKLHQIMELATRVTAFESEVMASEAYIRKTLTMEGTDLSTAAADFDFMDM
jgi:COP9 signalosome complex subunit 3